MTDNTLADKTFSQESREFDTQTLAAETKALIRKIKKHIEDDGCVCCKEALSSS